jgi:hypothetical protein
VLCGAENANALNEDFTILQMPQALKLHNATSLEPKSHMHWEPWKTRNSLAKGVFVLWRGLIMAESLNEHHTHTNRIWREYREKL